MVETGPVGTNYFKFESRSPGEETVVSRNDEYWDTPALLQGITFKVVTEPGTRIAELESGSSDAILSTLTSNTDRIEETDGMTLMRSDAVNVDYIGFNTSKEPFDDPKIRQAISHALTVKRFWTAYITVPAYRPMVRWHRHYSATLKN